MFGSMDLRHGMFAERSKDWLEANEFAYMDVKQQPKQDVL